MLEPGAVKVARPVLRGLGVGNGPRLLGEGMVVRPSLYSTQKGHMNLSWDVSYVCLQFGILVLFFSPHAFGWNPHLVLNSQILCTCSMTSLSLLNGTLSTLYVVVLLAASALLIGLPRLTFLSIGIPT